MHLCEIEKLKILLGCYDPNPAIKSLIFAFALMLNAGESTLDLLQETTQ